MMINVLKNIFDSNNYHKVDVNFCLVEGEFFTYTPVDSANKEEYFVILELFNQSDENLKSTLEELSEYLFEKITNSGSVERYFVKNSTLIICHKDNQIERLTTLTLEEDLYNFKKNVITYSEKELNDFKRYIKEAELTKLTNSILKNIINEKSGSSFIKFKNISANNASYYSLLMKIFLKLPFLTYETQEKDLSKINEDINNELTDHQRKVLDEILDVKEEWNDETIHTLVSRIWGEKND